MAYCSDCGNEIDDKDKFCSECGLSLEEQNVEISESAKRTAGLDQERKVPSGGWWTLILILPATLTLVIVSVFLGGFFGEGSLGRAFLGMGTVLYDIFLVELGLSIVLLPIAFHLDKEYVEQVANWSPSNIYYLLAIPGLNVILGLGYLQQRHEAVGKP